MFWATGSTHFPERCSADDLADAVPAHAGEPGERGGQVRLERVVHEHGTALYGPLVQEPPVARVLGPVAVVAQREELAGGHHQRPPVVARRVVGAPGEG